MNMGRIELKAQSALHFQEIDLTAAPGVAFGEAFGEAGAAHTSDLGKSSSPEIKNISRYFSLPETKFGL